MRPAPSLAPLALALCLPLALPPSTLAAPEALQISPDLADQLPGGKEADGIVGDFLLRNSLVEAVIGNGRANRKPNLFVHYDGTPTPGCLYDLSLRGRNNDQLTFFAPSNLRGEVSHVRIVHDGGNNEAAVEVLVSAAQNQGLRVRHEYRLREGWPGLLIVTSLANETDRPRSFDPADRWAPLVHTQTVRGYSVGDAVDPADKAGYAFRWLETEGFLPPPESIELAPGATLTYARALVVAESPAAALGRLAAFLEGTSRVRGTLRDDQGLAITTARIELEFADRKVAAYPDARGNIEFPLPFGEYPVTVTDAGRAPVTARLVVQPDRESRLDLTLGPQARIAFDIRDDSGRPIPCKAQFIGTHGTPSPNLGPANRARGCLDQYHAPSGSFTVPVPPGSYDVVVTRGPEFSHLRIPVRALAGETTPAAGRLTRLVDSRGWISTDFHNHSTESGDNTTGTEDRLINLAAEHVEFAPATEHNRIVDWAPTLARLGLQDLVATVPGIELTGQGAHLNAFPFQPHPRTQDGGGPAWHKDPRVNAMVLRDFQGHEPSRWVQINHPDMIENWVDRDGDGRADGGYTGLTALLDAAETWGLGILTNTPYRLARSPNGKDAVLPQREFVWLQLLNQGHHLPCVAVSDAHGIHGAGVGGWRTYVRSTTDDPARVDWREIARNARAGRSFVTTGPFLEVSTEDGTGPGGTTRASAGVRLHVRVQCTDWIRIDRVQVLVNGRQPDRLNFTRATHPDAFRDGVVQFDRTIGVPLSQDAHVIVVAIGEQSNLATGFGTSAQANWNPCAYHNPIYVDIDGNGWQPNHDTLGWELPVRRIDPDQVRQMIADRAARP
jgi:hypothetical protein